MTKDAKLTLLGSYYRSHGLELSRFEVECLQRAARKAQRTAENLCNIPNYQEKFDKTVKQLEKNLRRRILWRRLDLIKEIDLSGDPRGLVLKIKLTNGKPDLYPHEFN